MMQQNSKKNSKNKTILRIRMLVNTSPDIFGIEPDRLLSKGFVMGKNYFLECLLSLKFKLPNGHSTTCEIFLVNLQWCNGTHFSIIFTA